MAEDGVIGIEAIEKVVVTIVTVIKDAYYLGQILVRCLKKPDYETTAISVCGITLIWAMVACSMQPVNTSQLSYPQAV